MRGEELEAGHDSGFDFEAVFDKEEFRKGGLFAEVEHAGEAFGGRVGEDVEEVRRGGFGPDGNGAAELLQPDFAPILAHGPGKELEVAKDAQPFVEVEFDVLFNGGPKEAAAPATTFAVGYGAADGAAGAEEEEVYVGVYL